ncbi:kinesin-like protein KIN-4C isoform X1 [Ananas comosus]|uniref:Kinesin-like protein KIN-4C isoform X1 n=1 Tax=Ananas comosus TaxID=4615 RepID=A0A6P5FD34_ANACO|nr:kinesin-like protein KIN-4C isoform X1 [Ananas comosus]
MESSEEGKAPQKECVKVAVNVRPLITAELLNGCTDCVTVVPGEPQVQIGSYAFTYDHVYGSSGSPYSSLFEECVLPLVDALFSGYNATVLAYGQTGSGKTYTMGTNYTGESNCGGIIPLVIETIFKKVEMMKDSTEFLIRVSFIEIFKEEVFDLLDSQSHAALRTEVGSVAKMTAPSRAPIQIRETANGGITLAGVTEAEVRTKEEMASYLTRGSLSRATGSTNMNSQSSRSHAIFTICIEQKRISNNSSNGVVMSDVGDDILFAKLHLVDLAGSERAKRTGADGLRLKEGIHINRGLLALGNVISALGDEKKRKEGGHVPYRDSKLTRLLQDSLGGNSKTVMIACISPADSNAEETINTLKYANRARNIQNKAVINRDPVTAEMQRMRSQLEHLQAELLFCRSGGSALEELQVLQHRIAVLEVRNKELYQELKERQITCEQFAQRALEAQVEKDKLVLKIESARNGKPWDEIDKTDETQELDLVKNYVAKIQQLETQLVQVQNRCRNGIQDRLVLEKDMLLNDLTPSCEGETIDVSIEAEEDEKEREHSSLQDRLDKELQELDKRLEQKEAEMKQFARVDTSVLKQHYEKKLLELEHEKKALQKEIEDLRFNLANISSSSDECAQKLKEDYLQKLNMLEAQVAELKKKQDAQAQLLRQKQKSDEAARRLQEEIQRIKSQKVQLQHKIKQESEQFRIWKASREKEVLQLKKEGRRNEYEMHKLLALNQRQKMVLQRKTEEASLATKRLKELLEAKKASSREISAPGSANGPGIQALMQAIEHELEVTVRVHEVRLEYERQMQERAAMSKEVARLKEESEMFKQKLMSDCPQTMSPSARSSRISALENMLATSSSTLVSMASQLSEAEERERLFSGRGRWNQVRSLAEAKNAMNYLFNLASSSRCQLRDKDVSCREKDAVISELKEKVVRLNGMVRQLEAQVKELHNLNMQEFSGKTTVKNSDETIGNGTLNSEEDGRSYALRKAPRTSQFFMQGRHSNFAFLDDMDISESEHSEEGEQDAEDGSDSDWVESSKKIATKRSKAAALLKPKSDDISGEVNIKPEMPSEEGRPEIEKNGPGLCCSCSKVSSCKTRKCECRAAGSICGGYCGCVSSKCANREGEFIKEEMDGLSCIDAAESGESYSSSDHVDDEKTMEMVSHGAMLLQRALTENQIKENLDGKPRRPLSDIGNTVVKEKGTKPKQRKNWRKSTIQLVPAEPPPPALPENNEAPRIRDDIPLRLPRAMDSAPLDNNNPLADRNAAKHDESVSTNKENRSVVPPRSPFRSRKVTDEKENQMK